MIGGGVLGVLLVGFFLMNMLAGGGGDEALPVAAADHRPGAGRRRQRDADDRADRGGRARCRCSPAATRSRSRPRSCRRAPRRRPRRPAAGTTPPATAPPTSPARQPRHDQPPPTDPGGGSSHGRRAARRSCCSRRLHRSGGEPMVQVEVDGTVYNVSASARRSATGVRAAVGLGRLCDVPVRRRVVHALRQLDEVGARPSADRPRRSAHGGSGRRPRGRPSGRPRPTCGRACRVEPAGRAEGVPYDVRMLRMLTAGESHGKALVAVLEGLPAGVPVSAAMLADELARRRHGHGRGGRQRFESDGSRS